MPRQFLQRRLVDEFEFAAVDVDQFLVLEAAQHAAAQDQGREQLRRFLTQGAGYQPTTVQMFH